MDFEATNELPISSPNRVTNLASSLKTDVGEVQDKNLVIKVNKEIINTPRKENESDEDYKRRRVEASIVFIKNHLERSRETKSVLNEKIIAPEEHHFIALADDGYPAPFRVQEKISGEKLVNINLRELGREQKRDLGSLIESSIECYRKYGRFMDLVGLIEGKTQAILPELKRHISPLKNSENIFVTGDGRIALIDIESLNSSPIRNVVKFLSFTFHYWKNLRLS